MARYKLSDANNSYWVKDKLYIDIVFDSLNSADRINPILFFNLIKFQYKALKIRNKFLKSEKYSMVEFGDLFPTSFYDFWIENCYQK